MIFIPKENIDSTKWDISEYIYNKETKIKYSVNSYIKIQIIDKRINQNDTQIKSIGVLSDIPTELEIEKFYGVKVIITDKNIKQNDIKNYDDKYNNKDSNIEEKELKSNFII